MRTALASVLLLLAGCGQGASSRTMVYCALDEELSRPLLLRYADELGIEMVARYDTEGAKTVGLVSAIREEQDHPRCSIFWNNELAHTVALAQAGLLDAYDSPAAAAVPAAFKDPQHRWTGFAARARILVVNTELLPDRSTWPHSYKDLADPKWKGRCAVARPLTGTTLTHFAALQLRLGAAEFDRFFAAMQQNDVRFLASNGATLNETAAGKVAWAFTDTDDYHVGKLQGKPIACVFPDQEDGGIGTMLIPNSAALVRGGPAPEQSRKLLDRILSAENEALLAAAAGAQIPLRPGVAGPDDPAIPAAAAFRAMQWDPELVAAGLARSLADFGRRFGL